MSVRPEPSLADRTLTSGLWLFSGTGLQGVLRLVVLTILARLLGPPEFGLAAAATVVIAFFRVFVETGIRPAVIQRPVLETRHIETAFALSMLLGGFGALAIWLAAPQIAGPGFGMPELTPVIRVMALLLPIQSFGLVASGLLQRELRFDWVVRSEVLSYVFGYAPVGIGMAFAGYGVWALVGAYLVQELLRTVVSLWVQPHSKRMALEPRALRELGYFGSGFAVARLGNYGALNGDKWVAGRWLGQEALGFYKYAFELTQMIGTMFGQVIDKVLFPAMAKLQDDRVRLATGYRRGVALIGVLVLPVSAVLTVLAPEIIHLVLGDGWEEVVAPFRVLAAALLIRSAYTMSDSLARATGAVYRRAWRQAAYAVLVIGLAWLGQRDGLVAMTVGVVVGISVNFLLMAHLSVLLADLRWRDVASAHLGALPAFVVALLACWAASEPARRAGLSDASVAALGIGATGLALLLGLRLAPRWLLGREGVSALEVLWSFGNARTGGWLARIPIVRSFAPRRAER